MWCQKPISNTANPHKYWIYLSSDFIVGNNKSPSYEYTIPTKTINTGTTDTVNCGTIHTVAYDANGDDKRQLTKI